MTRISRFNEHLGIPAKNVKAKEVGWSFALGDGISQAKHRLCFGSGRESLNVLPFVVVLGQEWWKEFPSQSRLKMYRLFLPHNCGEGVHNVKNQKITNYFALLCNWSDRKPRIFNTRPCQARATRRGLACFL